MADAEVRVKISAEAKEAQAEIDKLQKKLDSLYAKGDKFETLGVNKQSKQWKSLEYDVAQTEIALMDAQEHLIKINGMQMTGISDGFGKASQAAKKFGKTLEASTKKSNGMLKTMAGRLKGIALSLMVFNWITKGFNAMVAAMKDGFQNLAQYSGDYNSAMSELKSRCAELKNGLAAAFEPVANMIIPALTRMVEWLNIVTDKMAQFLAALSGKTTYTRAKKQVIDYAKGLKRASEAAKGSLASFDKLNILSKKDGGESNGGEVKGADAFEEVAIDKNMFGWATWLKENLDTILTLVEAIGVGIVGWKITSHFMGSLSTVLGIAMFLAGAFIFVKAACDAFQNGVNFENLTGMLLGTALLVAGLGIAFGPMAAVIGAVASGITMLIIGIKDIIENGVTLENSLLTIAGVFTTVSAIACAVFGPIGVVVGAVAAVIAGVVLAIIKDWENFKRTVIEPLKLWGKTLLKNALDILAGAKKIFGGIIEFITGVFTLDWKRAWGGITKIFTGICDTISGVFKGAINIVIGVINAAFNVICGVVNAIVRAVNSIKFTVPEWVPLIGGKGWEGLNIPTLPQLNFPYLAEGAVIPGGRPFAAILGDQRAGQVNIESPLSTIEQALSNVIAKDNGMWAMNLTINFDGDTVFKNMIKRDRQYTKQTGHSAFLY